MSDHSDATPDLAAALEATLRKRIAANQGTPDLAAIRRRAEVFLGRHPVEGVVWKGDLGGAIAEDVFALLDHVDALTRQIEDLHQSGATECDAPQQRRRADAAEARVDALTRVVDAATEFVSEQDSWLNAPMEAEPPAPSVESFNRLRDELSALTKKDSTS